MVDEVEEYSRPDLDVVWRGIFRGVVADAATTTDKQHRERDASVERHRVVTGAARQASLRHSQPFHGSGERVRQVKVAAASSRLVANVDSRTHAALPRDLLDAVDDVPYGGFARSVVRRSDVEREGDGARDCVDSGMSDF